MFIRVNFVLISFELLLLDMYATHRLLITRQNRKAHQFSHHKTID